MASSRLKDYTNSLSILPFALYILVSFATQLLEIPFLRLFEKAICNRHYRSIGHQSPFVVNDVDETSCKIPVAQDQLSDVVGWKIFFDAIPGLLTAILYGHVAEKYGRRTTLLLAISGILLMLLSIVIVCSFDTIFSIQMIWISSIFLFIGGGQRVFCSMIYTIVSDSHGHSTRTKYLYLLAVGPHANRLIAPPIAGTLMDKNLYIPFWISISTYLLSLLIALAIKEPIHDSNNQLYVTVVDQDYGSIGSEESIAEQSAMTSPIPAPNDSQLPEVANQIVVWTMLLNLKIRQITRLFRSPASQFCLAVFFVKRIAFASESYVFQYASENLLWPLHQTTCLRVATASSAIFVTLIACPMSSSVLRGRGFAPHRLDLNTVRISLLVVFAAFFCAWKAGTGSMLALAMVFCGLGEGIEPALQGLITYLTDARQNALLLTTIAMIDTMGELAGGPLTARLMAVGRVPGHPSDGVCFLASSIMFGILGIWACVVEPKR